MASRNCSRFRYESIALHQHPLRFRTPLYFDFQVSSRNRKRNLRRNSFFFHYYVHLHRSFAVSNRPTLLQTSVRSLSLANLLPRPSDFTAITATIAESHQSRRLQNATPRFHPLRRHFRHLLLLPRRRVAETRRVPLRRAPRNIGRSSARFRKSSGARLLACGERRCHFDVVFVEESNRRLHWFHDRSPSSSEGAGFFRRGVLQRRRRRSAVDLREHHRLRRRCGGGACQRG